MRHPTRISSKLKFRLKLVKWNLKLSETTLKGSLRIGFKQRRYIRIWRGIHISRADLQISCLVEGPVSPACARKSTNSHLPYSPKPSRRIS